MTCRVLSAVLCLSALGAVGLRADEPAPATRQKSVTVYPVVITPSTNIAAEIPIRIAEVAGVFLEQAGMEQIELAKATFSPPDTDDAQALAAAFGQFVANDPPNTEYALFGQFVGTPATGPREIRTIVVDKAGDVIFADKADQQTFARSKIKPDCPMTCTLFMVDRLHEVWQLADPLRENAPQGKMAALLRARSGLPSAEELSAIDARLEAVKGKLQTSGVTVYPVHLWPGTDKAAAAQLATMLKKERVCQAETTDTDLKLAVAGDPNEQRVLWDTARAFQKFLRGNPPATQYALLADYAVGRSPDGQQQARHVHLILCDATGDWVLVDFQNSHHDDFQHIDPQSLEDCNRLAVVRLKSRLAE